MRLLLLSAYDAPSHRYWREGLCRTFSHYHWTCLTLPPRHFHWRIRGNPLSWLEAPQLQQPYDAIVATSMVDLACLRGLVPALAHLPCLYYFHENQFDYPQQGQGQGRLEPQMVSLYGALSSQRLAFNSHYNQRTFLEGAAALMAKFPDHRPKHWLHSLAAKSHVLPVPLAPFTPAPPKPLAAFTPENPLNILWNHRWEYDKGPERLLAIIQHTPAHWPVRWFILGQQFRNSPAAFGAIQQLLQQRQNKGHVGFIQQPEDYRQVLQGCHWVLSTALHDFQGLAVLEAVAAGCVPVVPNRLAYPEWFAAEYCYPSHAHPENEAQAVVEKLAKTLAAPQTLVAPSVQRFSWDALQPAYSGQLQALISV